MKKLLFLALVCSASIGSVLGQTVTVAPSSTTYSSSGGQISFTVSLSYPANASAVSFSAKPPTGSWAYVATGGANVPAVSPHSGDTTNPDDASSVFGWTYTSVPAGSASFTFVLSHPAGLSGDQVITFAADYRLDNTLTPMSVPPITLTIATTPEEAPAIVAHPADVTVPAGENADFTVGVTGSPAPAIRWQRSTDGGGSFVDLSDGLGISGAETATLTLATTAGMNGHRFQAIASNGIGADAVSDAAMLTITFAPEILLQPRTQAVALGGTLRLTTAATGSPAPSFVWKKGTTTLTDGGNISGATTATLTITNFQSADAGTYTVVASNGISPDATSSGATVTLAPAGYGATHAIVGAGYVASGTITITNTITYTGDISSLGYSVTLPTGWTYDSSAGTVQGTPQGTVGTLTWAWTNISSLTPPVTFTYTLNVPADANGTYFFPASAIISNVNADQFTLVANPDPLLVGPVLYHSADTNGDFKINLSELLRVISYYNTRFTNPDNTKVQTGAYKLQSGTPDGYAPDLAKSTISAANQGGLASYHSADTDRNGSINLSELLRVISYYNTRFTNPDNTKVQTGAYKVQAGTPDGYAPDLTRAP